MRVSRAPFWPFGGDAAEEAVGGLIVVQAWYGQLAAHTSSASEEAATSPVVSVSRKGEASSSSAADMERAVPLL
jgi:hypothetical protein